MNAASSNLNKTKKFVALKKEPAPGSSDQNQTGFTVKYGTKIKCMPITKVVLGQKMSLSETSKYLNQRFWKGTLFKYGACRYQQKPFK